MHAPPRPPDAPRTRAPSTRHLIAVALASLVAGALYYAALRGASPIWSIDPSAGTFPSLAHGFATTLLLLGAVRGAPVRHAAAAIGANLLLTAALEAGIGTFDPMDLVALGVGAVAAAGYARAAASRARVRVRVAAVGPGSARRVAVPLLLAASAGMTVATGPYHGDPEDGYRDSRAREPVYLSYDELRRSVRVSEPRPLDDIGRVYLHEDFLFLNARNEGVHVVDNSDPANPRPVSFIEIPGNTELEIADGFLYADSYVDLVVIALGSLGAGPRELPSSRQTDIFPWDPYQSVPADTYFNRPPDEALGVVVGVEEDGE